MEGIIIEYTVKKVFKDNTGRPNIIVKALIRLMNGSVVNLSNEEGRLDWVIPFMEIDRGVAGIELNKERTCVLQSSNLKMLHVYGDRLPDRVYHITKREHIEPAAKALMDRFDTVNGHKMTVDGYVELLKRELKDNLKLNDRDRGMLYSKQIIESMTENMLAYPGLDWEGFYAKKHTFFENDELLNQIKEYPNEQRILSEKTGRGDNS